MNLPKKKQKINEEAVAKLNYEYRSFVDRHVGPDQDQVDKMLKLLGADNLDNFIAQVVPDPIKASKPLTLDGHSALTESEMLDSMQQIANKNQVWRSYIGCGYYGTRVPVVIQRNILENPSWYTQYTPYQPEISQGRLEALLNFQTMVSSLTGLEIANASLLDEATAAAEAMYMAYNIISKKNKTANKIFIDVNTFPQTISVVQTRAKAIGVEVLVADYNQVEIDDDFFAVLIQYPAANGEISSYQEFLSSIKNKNVINIFACDLLALCLLKSPAAIGADIALGSSQRFGVPMGYGGPHAAFFACKKEYQRLIPGRLVGVSKDRLGNPALRLALQTREQHIRREKATSNICTAQVLLAVMASMYAVYHGPAGLKTIANRVNRYCLILKQFLVDAGCVVNSDASFDTLEIIVSDPEIKAIKKRAEEKEINLGYWKDGSCVLAIDETLRLEDLLDVLYCFTGKNFSTEDLERKKIVPLSKKYLRDDQILKEQVFNSYHTETEFLRYVKRLESKDLSLAHSMIPLGSCTMKLNATTEMIPVTWKEFANMHPFCPEDQAQGYAELMQELREDLLAITAYAAVSLQPNAGSQGEFAGLLAIRAYLESIGEETRKVCLIPKSAHGTNPASAVIAGFEVVVVDCDSNGNIDVQDLESKVSQYKSELAALMITYPSTHGVFEIGVKKICKLIHDAGAQVYLDGANLNALVGLAYPAELGADVMHINLHKTFCIPHGGGGPGVGPIAVKEHLKDFLPSNPLVKNDRGYGPVSAAPYGSSAILPISYSYIKMMAAAGLEHATKVAILNANYIAKKLAAYYPVLYSGDNGRVAHECVLDCRAFKELGVEVEDIAKRLIDYGFHAPTVSWPVPGTIMIEPTESENLSELNRFCAAMIEIYNEIQKIKTGEFDRENNPLKNAPHVATELCNDNWFHPYSREIAAFPVESLKQYKFWPASARIDSVYGDRNLICSCSGFFDE